MKTRIASLLTLAAVLGFVTLGAQSAAASCDKAIAYRVSKANTSIGPIERGDKGLHVLRLFGTPDKRLARNIWVYHNQTTDLAEANAYECAALVVTFENNRVSNLEWANCKARAVIAANGKARTRATVATRD